MISEEEFQRLQNTVVELRMDNYSLQQECKCLKQASVESSSQIVQLRIDLEKSQNLNSKSKKASYLEQLLNENESLIKRMSAQGEEFRLQHQSVLTELGKLVTTNESLLKQLEEQKRSNASVKTELEDASLPDTTDTMDDVIIKNLITSQQHLQSTNLEQKLKRKQESFLQLQKEKEHQYNEFSEKLKSQEKEHALIIDRHTEDYRRLQMQLRRGFDSFDDFKAKKVSEIAKLNSEIERYENLTNELGISNINRKLTETTEKFEDLQVRHNRCLEEYEAAEAKLNKLSVQLEELSHEKSRFVDRCNELKERNKIFEVEICALKHTIQQEKLESEKNISLKNNEITEIRAELTSKNHDFDLKVNTLHLLEDDIKSLRQNLDLKCSELEATCNREKQHINEVNHLETQLEIANTQLIEFQEKISSLVSDYAEERKISERKKASLVKDLKRQLLSEKLRNDTLTDKVEHSMFLGGVDTASSFSDCGPEIETDRVSNSSWSYLHITGQSVALQENESVPDGTEIGSSPVLSSLQGGFKRGLSSSSSSLSPVRGVTARREKPHRTEVEQCEMDENRALIRRISVLQEEKIAAVERIQMLEHSSAAMADDLVKKAAIIKYYCMDSKSSVGSKMYQNEDKMSVKKLVGRIVNSSHGEDSELSRMQRMMEETLTKNMHLQTDLEVMSKEFARLSAVSLKQ